MAIPANIEADLMALDATLSVQASAMQAATDSQAALTAAQAKAQADQAAVVGAMTATHTAQQTLLADIAAWVASGSPPAAADLKTAMARLSRVGKRLVG